MDGISAAASIIAVLQLTGSAIQYLTDVKDATKECKRCTIEAANLQNLLVNLRYRLEEGEGGEPWFTAVRSLSVEHGPLDQYKEALELLLSKVHIEDGQPQKLQRRLLWTLSKAEVARMLEKMERLKSLLSIALEMDHLYVLSNDLSAVVSINSVKANCHKLSRLI